MSMSLLCTFDEYVVSTPDKILEKQEIENPFGNLLLGCEGSALGYDSFAPPPDWVYNSYNYCLTISPKKYYDKLYDFHKQEKLIKTALKNTLSIFRDVKIYGNFEFYNDMKNIHFHGVVHGLKYSNHTKFKARLYKMITKKDKDRYVSYKPLIDMERPYKTIDDFVKYCEKHKHFMKKMNIQPLILSINRLTK